MAKVPKQPVKSVLTFKTRIYPTAEQRAYFVKCFGIRRWVYNYAVAEFFKAAQNDVFPTWMTLMKQLNHNEVVDGKHTWLSDVNAMVRQEAFVDFGRAVKRYAAARHEAKRTQEFCHTDKYKPHFQKKGLCVESFRYNNKGNPWKYKAPHHFTLTVKAGVKPMSIRTAENISFLQGKKICTCTILREAGRFYVAVVYERTNRKQRLGNGTIGLDLGIKHPVVVFDGTNEKIFDLPESLFKAEKHRKCVNRRFSRTTKNSKRHARVQLQLQRAYARENNIKKDFREKLSYWLASNFDTIKIDDFTFASALNLQNTARALHRVGSYAFKLRLKQKASDFNSTIIIVAKGTPTTQMCSHCGKMPSVKITLDERVYNCKHCGFTTDRDANAARNAYKY